VSAAGEPQLSKDEPASQARSSRQFSLASLLWFVVVTSLWCSQIAVVRQLLFAETYVPTASSVVSVLVAWIALSWFCFRQRLVLLFVFQGVFPAMLGLGSLLQFFDIAPSFTHNSWRPFFDVTLGTNLLWFPIATIAMAIRWGWPKATIPKRHDRRMPWWP
jgi:hypothetical protein